MAAVVQLKEIVKRFSGVKALDGVNLEMHAGEVLSLVGENGAGKSTMMKILSGSYPHGSFEGQILIDGKTAEFHSPLDAEKAGIAIIHQELSSFAHLTVAENLFVGHWPTRHGLIDWERLESESKNLLDLVGATCDPRTLMSDLSVGTQQMVEIAKALSRKSRVLILDEPTSALTPQEVSTLFRLIQDLKAQGQALVYISHKMEEIYQISDRITVLRDGQTVHTDLAKNLPEDKLIMHMVGRSLDRLFPAPPPSPEMNPKNILLKVTNLEGVSLQSGKKVFGPLNFSLHQGEVLGFAGLLGAGRSELLQSLFGDPNIHVTGEVELRGKKIQFQTSRAAIQNQLAFVGEDRKRDSLLPSRSLDENVAISRLASNFIGRILNSATEFTQSQSSLKQLKTRTTGPEQLIQELSGGNQQKVIVARALQTKPDIILLDEPTRGVDVGAKYEIYEIIFDLVTKGKSFLLASSDLPELMSMSHRILVLNKGRQMGLLNRSEFSQTEIMKLAVAK